MTTMHAEPQGRADLHVHTTWSDGAQRPEAVVVAASGRVDVLAITDHDEIRGALVAREYARRHPFLGVDVIVGEEISTLNGALAVGRTRAHRAWAWTADKLPRHVHYQSRSLIKFLRLSAQRRAL